MKSTILLLAVLMLSGIMSCKKSGKDGEPDENGSDLKVWKNSVVHVLANQNAPNFSQQVVYFADLNKKAITNGDRNAYEVDMQLSFSEVYILLEELNSENTGVAKLAKNGVLKVLSDLAENTTPTAFTIANGTEYVLGNNNVRAFQWKNGQESIVDLNGSVNGVFVKNN